LNQEGKVAEGWRRLHNEELHNLYASPNTIRLIKACSIRCTKNLMGRDHSEDLGVDGVENIIMHLREIG
jgi:hypothetical protein